MVEESVDHKARQKVALVEAAIESHEKFCQATALQNEKDHNDIKATIIEFGKRIDGFSARLWGIALIVLGGVATFIWRTW